MLNKVITLFGIFFSVFVWNGICDAENDAENQNGVLVTPENEVPICPFTVHVHPEIIHYGDPLFVQLRFHNTTDQIVYMPFCTMDEPVYGSLNMMGYVTCAFEVESKNGDRTLYEWDGDAGAGIGFCNDPAWQIVHPGEEKTFAFVTKHTSAQLRPKTIPDSVPHSDHGMGEDTQGLEMDTDGCVGDFTVTMCNTSHWNTTSSKRKPHCLSSSQQVQILPRDSQELTQYRLFCDALRKYSPGMGGIRLVQLLGLHNSSQKPMPIELKDAYEQILSILTSGPLKDLLTQDLYVIRWVATCQPVTDSAASQKVLDEYEQWLETLPEVERDVLIQRMNPQPLRRLRTEPNAVEWIRMRLETYEMVQ